MKKSFADICLERAEKAKMIGEKLTSQEDVPELCRRLKRACELLRKYRPTLHPECYFGEVNKLESMPEDEK